MDHQDTVFRRYPEAQAVEEPPIFQHGQAAPSERSYWRIDAGPELDAGVLGRGTTEARAWADAARRLKTAKRRAGVVLGNC
jgi:hypothetical protein